MKRDKRLINKCDSWDKEYYRCHNYAMIYILKDHKYYCDTCYNILVDFKRWLSDYNHWVKIK